MSKLDPVPFNALANADLHVGRVYKGGASGNAGDDPIQELLPVGNQGGVRYKGSVIHDDLCLVALYATGKDRDWPDSVDALTGTVTYFGDNKKPGRDLHGTPRHGNEILRKMFERAHASPSEKRLVPPVLVFSKGKQGRDVLFQGLAVPGSPEVSPGDDLVVVGGMVNGERFKNYRATFTILDAPTIPRQWIEQILAGGLLGDVCPNSWRLWVETGTYTPLPAERREADVRRGTDGNEGYATGRPENP